MSFYYDDFGPEGLGWQRRFLRKSQMDQDFPVRQRRVQPLRVLTKMVLFKEARDLTLLSYDICRIFFSFQSYT